MVAHALLKPYLTKAPGRAFVTSLTHSIYRWSQKIPSQYYRYRVLEEYTIRYETGEITRLGLDKNKHYLIDAVLFVEPGYRSLNQGQTYTIGLEIKGSMADLNQDDKMEAYIGWVDYFFIAADGRIDGLIDAALRRASDNPLIGVMDIATGKIHKMPGRSQVPTSNYVKLLQNALYHYLFDDSKTTIVNIDTTPLSEPAALTTDIDNGVGSPDVESVDCPDAADEGSNKRHERTYRRGEAEAYRQTKKEAVQAALSTVDPTAQKVYEAIEKGVNKTSQIATEVGISISAVGNATAALKKAGLVDRQGGCRNAVYVTQEPPVVKYKGKCLKCDLYKDSIKKKNKCDTCESCEGCDENKREDNGQ